MNNKHRTCMSKELCFKKGINIDIACVPSASVWFRSNERPRRNGISGLAARKMDRGPPRSLTRAIFRAVFDSRSSLLGSLRCPYGDGNENVKKQLV